MKFNIVITCRDRYEYLIKNLYHINIANNNKNNDIVVFTVTNLEYNVDGFKNIRIVPIHIDDNDKLFNKSRYINIAIERMRKEYDYFIQWDVDLIMNPDLFDDIEKDGTEWIVLSGEKLTKESTEYLFARMLKYDNIKILGKDNISIRDNKMNRYVGNIAIRKMALEKYMQIMGQDKLYNEGFKSWGGEDSMLSITSTKMTAYKLLKKVYFYDSWNHLWHEREVDKPDFDRKQQRKNVELLNNQLICNERKIVRYKNKK